MDGVGAVVVDRKPNEITVIMEPLKRRAGQDRTVTVEALNCQRQIAARVIT